MSNHPSNTTTPRCGVVRHRGVERLLNANIASFHTQRDVILYNLGIGATEQELQWTFEAHDQFAALPTFGVIPQFPCSTGIPLDFVPNYNPVRFQEDS